MKSIVKAPLPDSVKVRKHFAALALTFAATTLPCMVMILWWASSNHTAHQELIEFHLASLRHFDATEDLLDAATSSHAYENAIDGNQSPKRLSQHEKASFQVNEMLENLLVINKRYNEPVLNLPYQRLQKALENWGALLNESERFDDARVQTAAIEAERRLDQLEWLHALLLEETSQERRDEASAALWVFLTGLLILAVAGATFARLISKSLAAILRHQEVTTSELRTEIAYREELEQQLRHSQKMEAVGTLAAGIAHDFNNSLTSILAYNELLKNATEGNSDLQQTLSESEAAINQASSIARSLLVFSRPDKGKTKDINVTDAAADSLKMLAPAIPSSIAVSLDSNTEQPLWIHADPGQLRQVLTNLIVNARDAMPNGGELKVGITSEVRENSPYATSPENLHSGMVVLTVHDNGHGMSKNTRERIFEPFFTTKPRGQGTGLGMSMVHGIVEAHNATMTIESAVGEGTTVRLAFPQRKPPRPDANRETVHPAGQPSKGRILIAEDNVQLLNLLATSLETNGHTVIRATDGEAALRVIQTVPIPVDLLLLDFNMPKLSGAECAEEALALENPPAILIMSGGIEMETEAQKLPGVKLLYKPFRLEEIAGHVDEAINARAAATESLTS